MDPLALRLRIRPKLADGRLPRDARVQWCREIGWRPERCDACDDPITRNEDVMECISHGPSQYFHSECMYVWHLERTAGVSGGSL
jgi:hypothetical protein